MTISGAMKFFRKSFADIDYEGVVVDVSTGGATRDNLRDRKRYTRWESVGSLDGTTETITITFEEAKTMSRLLLVRHNWKAFDVQYWNGSAWTHFAAVVTKEGTQANITETVNAKATSYYEFTPVSAERLRIQVTTTMVVDAQKYAYEVIATSELGTLTGYPVHQVRFGRTQAKKRTVRGMDKFTIFDEQYTSALSFQNYPTAADHTLMMTLWTGLEEFLIYPCGGDQAQYRFADLQGNRLEDVYLCWFEDSFDPNYTQNVYQLGLNYTLGLVEVA